MPVPAHLDWLVNTGNTIASADGHAVELWELNHAGDEVVISAWAKHSVSITVTMSCLWISRAGWVSAIVSI
jgi:hypothetical protein